jgi:osmotically-inducible protein OsmY
MRRADADIFVDARHALDRHPAISATVRVHVDKGIATLTGSVRLASESAEAEDLVRHVRGVARVVNDISVAQPPSEKGFEPPDRLG